MLVNSRRMILNVGGKEIRIAVGNDMTEDKMDRVLIVGKAYLQQYVYVQMVISELYMEMIEASLQKKKCFKFEMKKLWKECFKNLRKTICIYDSYVPNENFNNEYAVTYYDSIKDDLFKLRDKLATRFQNFGYGNKSGLYANSMVLYNLLTMCVNTYEAIMKRLSLRLGIDMYDVYKEFCPMLAFVKSYDFMRVVMGNDYESLGQHTLSKDVLAYFEKVRDGIFDTKTAELAVKNATEEMQEEERKLQGRYVDIDEVMSSDFPLDLVKSKKVS